MIEKDVNISTKHGLMPSFVAHPEGPGAWPGIIVFMDAQGFREEMRNHARRIARDGFFCVLPDMYYRNGTLRFDVQRRTPEMSPVISAARFSLTDSGVDDDTAAILAYMDSQDHARPGPIGTVGHCMGGRCVTTTAATFPHRVAAGASLYGVILVDDTETSPHRHLDGITAELYYGFGGQDHGTGPEYIEALRAGLVAAGITHTIEVFPDAGHGYALVERYQDSYAPGPAEQSWSKTLSLFHRALG